MGLRCMINIITRYRGFFGWGVFRGVILVAGRDQGDPCPGFGSASPRVVSSTLPAFRRLRSACAAAHTVQGGPLKILVALTNSYDV